VGKGKDGPLLNHQAMKMYGKLTIKLHTFLTLVLDGGQ
jgi:hypothetical protein